MCSLISLCVKISVFERNFTLDVEFFALKFSLRQFGLLKPFEVAELPKQLHRTRDILEAKQRYVIIDGQRRYFAICEILGLPYKIRI